MGTYDNLDSDNNRYFKDGRFYVPQGSTSATTSIQTANQLGEVNNRLNAGVFGVDIAPINPEILEQIPQQHFEEMHRLAKLSGASVSMHGPILDLVGFDQNRFNELKRQENERMAEFALDRAYHLNPEGNTFMNIHINNQTPGIQWRAATDEEVKAAEKNPEVWEGVIHNDKFVTPAIKEGMGFVNRDTGEIGFLKLEKKEYPQGTKFWTPDDRLESINVTSWDQAQLQIFQLQKEKREISRAFLDVDKALIDYQYKDEKGILQETEKEDYNQLLQQKQVLSAHTHEIDRLVDSGLRDVFHKMKFEPVDPKKAEELRKFRNEIQETYKKNQDEILVLNAQLRQTRDAENLRKGSEEAKKFHEGLKRLEDLQIKNLNYLQTQLARVGDKDHDARKDVPLPELYVPTDYIAKENTVKTISESMYSSYKQHRDKAPIFTLENYQSYFTLGTSDEMTNVIETARKDFAQKLMSDKSLGLDEKRAKAAAEKHIAATWDVGHINFMKRHGFKDEDVLKETEKIAPYVKQLHITDNFGFSDAHMPPGMGNAPIEKQFEHLKSAGFKFDKGRLIIEAGPYVGTFKENPQLYTLEQFNSPLYAGISGSSSGAENWSSFPGMSYGKFQTGFGNLLPDIHFRDVYGAGFSTLPRELGGQAGGDRDRFSGTPFQ